MAKDQTNDLSARLHGDVSKAIIAKKPDDPDDAIDRAKDSLEKYIKVSDAAALSVGAGAYEVEKLRAMALLEAAAEKEGIPLTSERAKGFQELAERAGQAAQALAKAKVANDIKFARATSLLSPEDVQIANALKHIYPDVATALGSVEAQGMRTNQALSGLSSQMSGTLTTGLTDILDGTKSVGDGFKDMSKIIIRAIEEMIVKLLIVGPLMRSLQGALGGFSFLGIGGGSAEATAFAGGIAPMANGGVFSPTGIHRFATGGIFDQATSFRFANGAGFSNGILGEAGPEAVMPLQRGKDGKLGIAGGGGGSVSAPISIHIDATGADAAGLARVQQQLASLQRTLPSTIVTTVKKAKTNRVL
jgi:lambda family phage tail tape measure protein